MIYQLRYGEVTLVNHLIVAFRCPYPIFFQLIH
ncbi:hypothetical protein [Pseudomonas sp. 28 E 9]|nr:hypothetical protein [Pseudomonas sp. 28 E 9]